jgi:hypothetical protein
LFVVEVLLQQAARGRSRTSRCALRRAHGIFVCDSIPRSIPDEFALEGEVRGRCYSLSSASIDVVSMEVSALMKIWASRSLTRRAPHEALDEPSPTRLRSLTFSVVLEARSRGSIDRRPLHAHALSLDDDVPSC